MSPQGRDTRECEEGFQIFLDRLLAMEARRIVRTARVDSHDSSHGFQIMFGSSHPLLNDLNYLRRYVHTGFVPRERPASTQY